MKFIIRKIIFFLIILIPFWSFLVWFFWPKTELSGFIMDKTVLNREGMEHRSLNWVLTHQKFVKPNGSQYDISDDYYGFFPVSRPEYVVKDLTVFDDREIDSLSNILDFVFYTDAYGIYTNEWVYGRDINERSRLVYGGLSSEAYELFKAMYRKRNMAITEFNNLASPTALDLRFKMSRLLEIDFTGWTGRYYHSLDTIKNPDIPRWMRRLHKRYYGKPFDYPDIPGIVLVHESERIMVMQNGKDLDHEIPIINTPQKIRERFGLPEFVRFPYWFDVTFALDSSDIYATYKIHTNESGDSMLASHGLPNEFPALIGDSQENLRYYMCGDWSDNPVPFGLSYFKGAEYIRKLFYNNRDPLDRKKFFWEYYIPLVTKVFEEFVEREDTLSTEPRPLPPAYANYVPYYRRNNIPLPDIEAITSGRRYNPDEVLGTQYIEAAFRDSMRRAIEEEAARTGYYIGEYGDTIYLEEIEKPASDTAVADSVSPALVDSLREDAIREDEVDTAAAKSDTLVLEADVEEDVPPVGYHAERYRVGGRRPYRGKITVLIRDSYTNEIRKLLDTAAIDPMDTAQAPDSDTLQNIEAEPSAAAKGGIKTGKMQPKRQLAALSEEDEQRAQRAESKQRKREMVPGEKPEEDPENTSRQNTTSASKYPTNLQLDDEYRLVIGTFKSATEAENLKRKVNDEEAFIVHIPKKNQYRLVYRSYTDVTKADKALTDLLQRFPNAWVVRF